MSIPTVKASTTHVDEGSDKISLARPDIKQNIDNVNEIIDHLNASGASTLMVPLTGFVVVKSAHDSFEDSAGGDGNFYRMALLGGAYYLRNGSTEPSLTPAVTSSYGQIEGASVSNSTSITKTEPTGFSASWASGTNAIAITDGVIAMTSNSGSATSNASVGIVGPGNPGLGGASGYVGYYTGYDSYVTLPAGTYTIEMKTLIDDITDNYNYESFETDNSYNVSSDDPDFWIYNKTDDVAITDPDFNTNQGADNDIGNIQNWNKDGQVIFTLSGTKDIAFYNPADTYNSSSSRLLLNITTSSTITGDFVGSPKAGGGTITWYDGSNYVPARLGWVTPIERTFIKITKLA